VNTPINNSPEKKGEREREDQKDFDNNVIRKLREGGNKKRKISTRVDILNSIKTPPIFLSALGRHGRLCKADNIE
jgi:hypothetical protein